jgi:hypothetical protein
LVSSLYSMLADMVLEACSSEVSWAGCQVGDYAEQRCISLYNLVFLCLHQSLK